MLQTSPSSPRKPTKLLLGTCGGCKGYDIPANTTELASIECTNKESVHFGTKPGVLQMNGCTNYVPKEKAPEGFEFY